MPRGPMIEPYYGGAGREKLNLLVNFQVVLIRSLGHDDYQVKRFFHKGSRCLINRCHPVESWGVTQIQPPVFEDNRF